MMICYFCTYTLAYPHATWVSLENNSQVAPPTLTVVSSNETTYQVKVNIHGYYDEIVNEGNNTYHRISLGTDYTTAEIGQPAMPTISQFIALPSACACTSSISENKWIDINIGRILPYQKPLLETEQSNGFIIDENVYNQEEFKTNLINRSDTSTWRDIRNIAFSICPFRYYPKGGKLSILKEFVFTVSFCQQSDAPSAFARQKKQNIFDNDYFTTDPFPQCHDSANEDSLYNYLIIVGDDQALLGSQAIKEFRKWKAIKGYKTKVISTTVTGKECRSIKKYIESEYTYNKKLSYILFIGDDDRIPMYDKKSFLTSDILKSDYWYGCMDGENDFQADVVIGRFSTNTVDELENMINKTIAYESTDNQYAQLVQLVANKEYAPKKYQKCCEEIRTTKYDAPMTFIKAYGSSISKGGTDATNAEIISRINEGVNIVNYRGHGDWNQWWNWNSKNQSFYNRDVDSLKNTIFPIIFGIACTTADIRNRTCLLESFMKSKHGSVAYIGATVPSYTEANHIFNKLLFKELLTNSNANIGDLNLTAHIKNISGKGDYTSKDNAFSYICGNDPTLEIWTQRPQTFKNVTVSYNSNAELCIHVDSITNFTASVISQNGELRYKTTSPNDSITLSNYQKEDLIYLNKHNFIPYKVKVPSANPNITYIQNQTFNEHETIDGNIIKIGYDVTPTIQHGNVIINNGARIEISSKTETIIKNGFECKKGATFIVK